jgi:hypothetical protein
MGLAKADLLQLTKDYQAVRLARASGEQGEHVRDMGIVRGTWVLKGVLGVPNVLWVL